MWAQATPLRGLYAITDAQHMPTETLLCAKIRAALKGGARIVQYREKSLPLRTRLQQARLLKALCTEYHAPLIINDDIELAATLKLGVHLGKEDGDICVARTLLGSAAIIGVSCYADVARAEHAVAMGANYVAFGAMFPSVTKPEAKSGAMSALKKSSELTVPTVAIGGITQQNAKRVIEAGAQMIAVIHDLFAGNEVYERACYFSNLFEIHPVQ